ncbi:MAG: TerB family tellurite resistance protein [Planctomycetota bacterium]|nr:TerB family tellurite resistance protein [Planctomycetota bacterium]
MDALESFQYLTYMALADGTLQKEEKPLLKKFGKRLGLSSDAMNEVLAAQKKELKLPKALPKNQSERHALFKNLCRMALADHEVASKEKALLRKVGKSIGMDKKAVEDSLKSRLEKSGETKRKVTKSADKVPSKPAKAAETVAFEGRDSFRYLCSMALADGVLDDQEVIILQKFGAQLGLSPEQRQEILNEQNRSKDPVQLPNSEDERQKLFRQVSKMALADEDVAAEEFLILARIGKTIGMDKDKVETFLKKELKKQVHRATSKDRAEASKLRSTGLKLAAVAVMVIALIGAYKALEKTDKRVDGLSQAVAALDSEAELSQFQELKTKIESFQSASPIGKVKDQATELLSELKAKKKTRAEALAKAVAKHIESDRSEPSWGKKAQSFLEEVNRWKKESPTEMKVVAQSLKDALEQGDVWGQWGRKVLREAHAHWPDSDLHKEIFKSSKAVVRQPVTVETLQEKLRKVERQGTDAILLLVADIQHHPYLPQSYYQRRIAEARDMLARDLGKKHKDELIAFASRLKSCVVIGAAYREALEKSMKAAQAGQEKDALKAFESSLYSQDSWFKAVISWLKSDVGQAFLALQKK